jgi:hypothetical protein
MKSETVAVQQLFQDRRQYRVPFYQRAYVWNREDQWERLWSDIQEKAEGRLSNDQPAPHFLGAVVLEPQPRRGLLGVETLHIIDGQQRLTTLQYVLAALAIKLRKFELSGLLSLVECCIRNGNFETMEAPEFEQFKVWPTFRDRNDYQRAMHANNPDELRVAFPNSFTQAGDLRKIGIEHPPALEAICYFYEQIEYWIKSQNGNDAVGLVNTVAESILRDLRVVSITLGEDDDAQVIFETLNGHGAELHATDLIRNFIFMRADRENATAGQLYDTMWSPFESTFWIDEQRRGRLRRPRIEWFVQTALQAELGEEIDIGRLYVGYRRFAIGQSRIVPATEQLQTLTAYSEAYRQLILGQGDKPIALFGRRIAAWDASAAHSLALLIAKTDCSTTDQTMMFNDIVSYLVRRAVCGLTSKNYNKVFVQQLKRLFNSSVNPLGFHAALASLQGDASRWPGDEEFRKSWLEAPIYAGRLDAAKCKAILIELENALRSKRSEEPVVSGLENLDVDHILPTSWFEHWSLSDGHSATSSDAGAALLASFSDQPLSERHAAIRLREVTKTRIGNLTLLHYGVNRSLQHYNFPRKREALFAESNLHLNRSLMRADHWDERAVDTRGRELFEVARRIWKGPELLN